MCVGGWVGVLPYCSSIANGNATHTYRHLFLGKRTNLMLFSSPRRDSEPGQLAAYIIDWWPHIALQHFLKPKWRWPFRISDSSVELGCTESIQVLAFVFPWYCCCCERDSNERWEQRVFINRSAKIGKSENENKQPRAANIFLLMLIWKWITNTRRFFYALIECSTDMRGCYPQ